MKRRQHLKQMVLVKSAAHKRMKIDLISSIPNQTPNAPQFKTRHPESDR